MSLLANEALDCGQPVDTPYPDSPWVVMKLGGASVSTAESWAVVAGLVRQRLAEGARPLLLPSALPGASDQLIALLGQAVAGRATGEGLDRLREQYFALASELEVDGAIFEDELCQLQRLLTGVRLVSEASPRVSARVLSAGELMATALGAAYLNRQGITTRCLAAAKLLIAAKGPKQTQRACYLAARCDYSPDPALQARLAALDGVLLTQGSIAGNTLGDTVLFGRDSSDTSAAYFAAKLQARRLEIWSDPPGFFSADPQAEPSARLIRRLDYRAAQEITAAGGGTLHPRCISPVRAAGIPLLLRSLWNPDRVSTLVSTRVGTDVPHVKAVSQRSGITLFSMESLEMWQQVDLFAEAFACFRQHGLSVELLSTSESKIVASVDPARTLSDSANIAAVVEDLRRLCKVTITSDCAAVTLIGQRIRAILYDLAPLLRILKRHEVHLLSQSATDSTLTFVVDSEHAPRLAHQLHALLPTQLAKGPFGPTWKEIAHRHSGTCKPRQPSCSQEPLALLKSGDAT